MEVSIPQSRIFISYRHKDTEHAVGRLAEDLRQHFASEQVFQDIASIDPGADFVEALRGGLDQCAAVLVVIGPNWLSAADKKGRRLLDLPADWVRHEIVESLKRPGTRVFPVLVGDADMPGEEDLPEPLQPLTRRQAFELTVRHWTNDVEQLVNYLKKVPGLDGQPARPSSASTYAGADDGRGEVDTTAKAAEDADVMDRIAGADPAQAKQTLFAASEDSARAMTKPLMVDLGARTSAVVRAARNLTDRVSSTPASIGVRIASWSALVASLGAFLPWLDATDGRYTGIRLITDGLLTHEVIFVLLSTVTVLALRGWVGWSKGARAGAPLSILGFLSLIVLHAVLGWAESRGLFAYGLFITLVGSLGILAGGIAELVLYANEERPAALKFPVGHIVANAGACLALLGALLTITQLGYQALPVGLLIASSTLTWLWALLSQRHGRLTWVDILGDVFAAGFCISALGTFTALTYHLGYVEPIVVIGGGFMLTGSAANFVSWLRAKVQARRNSKGT